MDFALDVVVVGRRNGHQLDEGRRRCRISTVGPSKEVTTSNEGWVTRMALARNWAERMMMFGDVEHLSLCVEVEVEMEAVRGVGW